jgi:Fic family protein
MDGNGRIARFLMNTMLISGGYSWTVVQSKYRKEYLSTLERASVGHDIRSFVRFIAKEMENKN